MKEKEEERLKQLKQIQENSVKLLLALALKGFLGFFLKTIKEDGMTIIFQLIAFLKVHPACKMMIFKI